MLFLDTSLLTRHYWTGLLIKQMSAVYTQTQMILAVPATFNIWCKLCIGTIALPTTDDTSYVRDDINLRPSLEL